MSPATAIDAWLRESGLAPRTWNNIRTAIHTLFEFAKGQRYLYKDHDELNSVAVANDRDGDIEVLTPAEMIEVLCCASEPFAWKHNALRHSFISYRVADIQNIPQVTMEAGNRLQMILKHYRELVQPKAAKEWFAISPAVVEKQKAASKMRRTGRS